MNTVAKKSKALFAFFAGFFVLAIAVSAFLDQYLFIVISFATILFYAGWENRNTIFFLLLLTLPLSFEYNFSSTLGTDIPDEFLMLLTSCLFLAYWLFSPGVVSKKMRCHPLLLLLYAAFVWQMIAVLFSTNLLVSTKFLLAKTWYISAFVLAPLLVFSTKKSIKIAAQLVAGSMLFIAATALIRHANSGLSFATINDAVAPFFRNHVNYSAMLVCMVPVLFACRKLAERGNLKWVLGVVIVIALVALFFSYARGAWLALMIGILSYWLIKKKLLVVAYISFIIVTIAAVFWLKSNDRYLHYAHDYQTTIFHKEFKEHLIATYKLRDVSTAERFYRWIAGVRMIKDSWLTGYGPNTFYDNYKPYAVPAFKTWVSNNKEHSTVHNYFLLTVIEQGVPGLLLFIILLGGMLYYAQKLYHRVQDIFYRTTAITIGIILTMLIVVNFLSDLIETDKIGSLFFLCLSLLIIIDINAGSGTSIVQTDERSDPSTDVQCIS